MQRRWTTMVVAMAASLMTGCWWPRVVPVVAKGPLYHSGFPLTGPARMDAALCSLSSVGGDVTQLLMPPVSILDALPLTQVCSVKARGASVPGMHQVGMIGQPVEVPEDLTMPHLGARPIRGFLYLVPNPRGVVVLFSGLAMPAAGWINARFAELAALRGYASFALIRDESSRPMRFDPRLEALRGIVAGREVRRACGMSADATLAFLGISMGGIEALLAVRDSPTVPEVGRAAGVVLDPIIDPGLVAKNLDSYWRSLAVDAMQTFFRRILVARYGEPEDVSFVEFLSRTTASGNHPTYTDPGVDSPAQWLCKRQVRATVYLSTTDPVLGDEQRTRLSCEHATFKQRSAGAPGHIPLACNLPLFKEMIDDLP